MHVYTGIMGERAFKIYKLCCAMIELRNRVIFFLLNSIHIHMEKKL